MRLATIGPTTANRRRTATVNSAIGAAPAAAVEQTLTRPAITAKSTGQRRRSHTLTQLSPARARSTASGLRSAMTLAYAARDEAAIEQLAVVPMDVLRASDGDEPEYVFAMVEMLGRFTRQEPSVAAALNSALTATDPVGLHPLRRDYVRRIVIPQLDLFHHLRDAEGFNQALAEALAQHKEYWTRTDDAADSPFGFIALGQPALGLLRTRHRHPDHRAVRVPTATSAERHVDTGTKLSNPRATDIRVEPAANNQTSLDCRFSSAWFI